MKIKDLLERSGVQSLSGGCGEEEITALTYDSRKAQTGSLFFCLRGARSNGEDFAPAAYAQGCRCFVSEGTLDVPEDADVVAGIGCPSGAGADLGGVFRLSPAGCDHHRRHRHQGQDHRGGDGLLRHEPYGPGLRRHRLQRGRLRREARGNQQYHTGELRADAAVSGHAG